MSANNGRITDVIIKDDIYTDPRTGLEVVNSLCFTVWADEDMKETIQAVEGVTKVYNQIASTNFSVYYDQRYDREFLKREIEAVILCKSSDV